MRRPDHIRQIVQERGINHLLHFTFEENLSSILKHGLLTREDVAQRDDIMAYVSDPYRDDEQEDAVCLSVTQFQAPMLSRIFRDCPDADVVILALTPDVLWQYPCRFCDKNAASSWIKNSPRNLATAYAFQAMFEDSYIPTTIDGKRVNLSVRERDELPPSVPTDPQAEVLVKANIDPEFIMGVWVETELQAKRIEPIIEAIPENDRLFIAIEDYSLEACGGN